MLLWMLLFIRPIQCLRFSENGWAVVGDGGQMSSRQNPDHLLHIGDYTSHLYASDSHNGAARFFISIVSLSPLLSNLHRWILRSAIIACALQKKY